MQPVVNIAKMCERRKCNHREAIAPHECLRDVVGGSGGGALTAGETNKHRYVLALASRPFQQSMERIAGLPIMHFNARGVLVLSPPSAASVRVKNAAEEERMKAGAKILDGVVDGGNVVIGDGEGRRKKPKAPNPLSVKKKKVEDVGKKRKVEEVEEVEQVEEDVGRRKKKKRRGRGKAAAAAAEVVGEAEADNGDDASDASD